MPARDRTGPRGRGPRTGWGMGYCGGANDSLAGRGFGRGRGLGRGWRYGTGRGRGFGGGLQRGWGGGGVGPGPLSDDLEGLRAESSRLKSELEVVERRLSSLDKQD